ncbi:uridine kinase-like protein 1, chloroplastic [Camellia sinensis]|uniref:uridine kinase-like protein 1, chloroplastic n=1 Tax=Camellia sinensis TaxID=4442 RepID=UPI00103608BE|nr:uridine kinase-like protein 1, chloroplastic [Camellia sinensis]
MPEEWRPVDVVMEAASGPHFSGLRLDGVLSSASSSSTLADSNSPKQFFVIGVSGGTASGKTAVCDLIIQQLHDHRVVLVNQDSFYRGLTTEEAQRVHEHNFDHPDAFDSEQLVECIEKLKSVQSVQVPIYDFKTITGVQTISSSEEKQLFPGSFKICDLNLMEDSEVNENVDCVRDPILFFPSIPESKKKATPADVDLSISNNGNIYLVNMDHSADGKEVEVIDLESDSLQADLAFNNSDRKRFLAMMNQYICPWEKYQ